MKPYWRRLPTRTVYAPGAARALGREAAMLGQRPLLLHGVGHLETSGRLEGIMASLGARNVARLGGVWGDVAQVRQAVDLAREVRADCVVAVGGGSVIDAAKATAFGVLVERDVWDFYAAGRMPDAALPVAAVPTTAPCCAEVKAGSVLANAALGQKRALGAPCLVPALAVLDPELARGCDWAARVADCLAMLAECLMATEARPPFLDVAILGLIEGLVGLGDRLAQDPEDLALLGEALMAGAVVGDRLFLSGRGRVDAVLHRRAHDQEGQALATGERLSHGRVMAALLLEALSDGGPWRDAPATLRGLPGHFAAWGLDPACGRGRVG